MTGRAVDGRAARQPVRAGRQRADVDVCLAVGVGRGVQAAQRLRCRPARGRADDRQRHLDVGRGRVVGVHRAHAHGDRLVAPVLEAVELQAQQRQRGIAHQPADGVLPEALERAPVVALAGREEAPVPAAVGLPRVARSGWRVGPAPSLPALCFALAAHGGLTLPASLLTETLRMPRKPRVPMQHQPRPGKSAAAGAVCAPPTGQTADPDGLDLKLLGAGSLRLGPNGTVRASQRGPLRRYPA